MRNYLLVLFVIMLFPGCSVVEKELEIVDDDIAVVNDVEMGEVEYLGYLNEEYGFKCDFLNDYKVEYMSEGEGIVMKKRVEIEDADEDEDSHYNVEIGVFAFENSLDYDDLSDYVMREYEGYSIEFVGDGVFINEIRGGVATRNYILMNGEVMYKAYLRLPTEMYNNHGVWFDQWATGIELL